MKKQLISMAIVATTLAFSGCGGGSDSATTSTATITGQFIDSAVQGLEYSCSSGKSGVTDLFGHFTCNVGDNVTFSINGFEIGSALAQEVVTPKTLFSGDATAYTNIAQLLQTLDSDNNPNNGITLDSNSTEVQALSSTVDVNFTQVDFDSVMTSYIGTSLVDETTANTHLDLTIQNISNSSNTLTELSVVVILNNVSESICQANNPYDHSYDGYSDFSDFLQAGGSMNLDYYATSKDCALYSSAGYCTVQDYSNVGFDVSGTGSCVQVITFPVDTTVSANEETNTTETSTPDTNTTVTTATSLSVIEVDTVFNEITRYFNIWENGYTETNELFFSLSLNGGELDNYFDAMQRGEMILSPMYSIDEVPYMTQKFLKGTIMSYTGDAKYSASISGDVLKYMIKKKTGQDIEFTQDDFAQLRFTSTYYGDNNQSRAIAFKVLYNDSAQLKLENYLKSKYTTTSSEISYSDFTATYKPMMPNLRTDNIYFFGSNTEGLSNLYLTFTSEVRVSDLLYTIGGNSQYSYEVAKYTYKNTTLSQEWSSSDGYSENYGTMNISVNNNIVSYSDSNGDTLSVKFSKPISIDALTQMYADMGMNVQFDSNDRAQFMLEHYASGTTDYIRLVLNESTYLKVKTIFETKIALKN